MKNLITLLLFFFFVNTLSAQETYNVSAIPGALMKEANVVKRREAQIFEIRKLDEAILYHKYALTILNEKGDKHAQLVLDYDKLHKIKEISGALYDAQGKQIRKLKPKEIQDISGVSDNSLIDDNRRKYFSFYHKVYPYTVEFEIITEYNNTLFFPMWTPQEDENYAVEQSRLTVWYPQDYNVRFKSFNYKEEPVATTEKNQKSLQWEVKNKEAIAYEFGLPSWLDITTSVLLAPSDFKIENYSGNMADWKAFGKFVYALKKDRDQLPDAVKQKVHALTDHLSNPKEKIQVLYQYLQQNNRYVSIQLGLGGWQPFDAQYVASKGYGDCKALTNYMYSLLKETGIPSYYTLIKAGRNASEVISDLPSQQFNHVILCVPLAKDTVWLECTSPTLPSGYLGDFTCDRYALLIDENGGQLIRTPKYGLKENIQHRYIQASIQPDGLLKATVKTNYGGLQQDNLHHLINNNSKDKVKEHLQEGLDFSTYNVNKFNYQEIKTTLPSIQEDLELEVSNYATITGKRLFITPNLMTKNYRKPSKETERKYSLRLSFEFQDIDTVVIDLPAGYELESMPQPVAVTSKFGRYTASVKLIGNKLYYYRDMQHYSGTYPASDYMLLADFYDAIYKADRAKVVFVKRAE